MEFREIATFLQAAQLKSFSKAAKKLNYSQGTVTIQIKNLEEELGVRLFDRIGKQISLTSRGEQFYQYAVTLMKNMEEIKCSLSDSRELTGSLALGTIESLCSSLLPPILSEYHRRFPKVNVSVVIDSPRVLLDRLNDNSLDIVYFLDKRISDPRWIKVLEEPEDIVFAASSLHPLAGRSGLKLDEIISHPFLLTEKAASYRLPMESRSVPFWKLEIRTSSSICCGKMQASPCFPSFLSAAILKRGVWPLWTQRIFICRSGVRSYTTRINGSPERWRNF